MLAGARRVPLAAPGAGPSAGLALAAPACRLTSTSAGAGRRKPKRRPFVNYGARLWEQQRTLWLRPPLSQEDAPARPRRVLSNAQLERLQALIANPTSKGALPSPMPLSQAVERIVDIWEDGGSFRR